MCRFILCCKIRDNLRDFFVLFFFGFVLFVALEVNCYLYGTYFCRMEMPLLTVSDSLESVSAIFPETEAHRNNLNGVVFLLVTGGKGMLELDGRAIPLCKGALVSVLPFHLLQLLQQERLECRILAFAFDFMDSFPFVLRSQISERMEKVPHILLDAGELQLLVERHDLLLAHSLRTSHASYQEIMRALVFVWLAEVSEIYAHKKVESVATHYEQMANQFFRLLHVHVRLHRDVAFYAGQLCVTPKYLSKVIRQVTDHTPSFWIADFTLKDAKALLKSSSLTITQLSEQLNFPNSSFFARYFKRHTGMSPQAYRARL